jgi:TonB family protein
MILMALQKAAPPKPFLPPEASRPEPPEARQRVFLPPAEVLRQIARETAPPPTPRAQPTPPPDAARSRISIGAPSPLRQKEPLILRRDQDLTETRKGRPDAVPETPRPEVRSADARPPGSDAAGPLRSASSGLRLPAGPGSLPAAREAQAPRVGAQGPSIASSLRDLDKRLQHIGELGAPTGTGQQMGPLFFDPEGADFTRWMQQFTTEVYRNWIMPQPALMGLRGHVEIEFTVERDGSVSALRVTRPSGVPSFDRAAQNALQASRFLPLPDDFQPSRVSMQVAFFYNEAPQGA